jgi:hypothetical protein
VLPGVHVSILSRTIGTIEEVRVPALATRHTDADGARPRSRSTHRRS